jgi:hypothetical protein
VGKSYDDHDLPSHGDGVWWYSDEGCDRDRGRCWVRRDLYASPGWAYGHQTSDGGCRYGDADSDAHAHADDSCHSWDGHTVRPGTHGYDRVHNGGRAVDQQVRQEH